MRVRCESEVSRHTEISNVVSWPPKITAFLSTSVMADTQRVGILIVTSYVAWNASQFQPFDTFQI